MFKKLIAAGTLTISLIMPVQCLATEQNFDIENIDFASGKHQIISVHVNDGTGTGKLVFSGKVKNVDQTTRSVVFSLCRGPGPQQITFTLVKQTDMESAVTTGNRIAGADSFLLFASENNLRAEVFDIQNNKQVFFLHDNKHLFILEDPVDTSHLPVCN